MALKKIVLKVTAKGAKGARKLLNGVSSAVTSIGKAAAITGAGMAALSLKLAGDFQKNLLEVSTLMDEGAFNIKKMGAELRNAAGASGLALSSLSKAKYDIVSAGFAKTADSARVLETSMQLAVGGVTSAAEAADLLTSSIRAYGLESDSAQKISDSLFVTVRQGKTNITQLAASLGQVLPFARSMKLDIDGVGVAMATMTAAGINTAEATTALKGVIMALESPGRAAKKAMEEVGIEVKRFGDGSVDLFETMKQFEGVDPETLTRIAPNRSAQLGIKAMSNNLETLKINVDAFKEAANNAESETDTAFNKMQTAFNTQMSRMKNNAQSGMILVGNALIEKIQPKIQEVNKLFEEIGEIGWDVVGERIKENSDTIMRIMKLTFEHALLAIKANVKAVALEIGQEIQIAVLGRFATDMSAQITQANKDAKTITESSISSIKGMYTSLFALLTRAKEEETEAFTESEGTKPPIVKKVTEALEIQGKQTDDLKTKEIARYETSISGIKNRIKAHYAEMIAKSLMGEADKGIVGIITGSIAATAFATMFDSLVPEFAQGGIVPGSGNRDTVPAMLTPGELILNESQQENLAGGMSNITVNVSAPLVDDHILDTIIPAINEAVKSNKARLHATTSKVSMSGFGIG